MRLAVGIEYCGANYRGWQRQHHAKSVQEAVEAAVSRVADHRVDVIASGRTDSGVHASGQILHFDSTSKRSHDAWLRGINTYLPGDIVVHWVKQVDDTFHARFDAQRRSYRYIILNRPVRPATLHGLVTWHRPALNAELMQQGCERLLGEHDFSAFRAAGCQSKNPVKRITDIALSSAGNADARWLWLDITATGFLHHMVRNIIGSLLKVGEQLEPATWIGELLKSRDRTRGGITAPPHGLYFTHAGYDQRYALPEPPAAPCFWQGSVR